MSDDNPYRNQEYPPYPPRRVDGAGVALGVVAGIVLTVLDVTAIVQGPPVGVVLGVLFFGFSVWLVLQRSPFAKGFGVGLLVTFSVALVLVGSCAALIAGSDF